MPPTTYTRDGVTYRPAGRCPWSELLPGVAFALPYDAAGHVHFRGTNAGGVPQGVTALGRRLVGSVYHGTVIVLEPV